MFNVRLDNHRVIHSCRVVAERHDRLHVAPRSIIICGSWPHQHSPLTTTTDKQSREIDIKIKHAILSVVRLWGILDSALDFVHYDTLHKIKRSIVAHDAYWSFPSLPNALRLCGQAFISWFHVVWLWHNTKCKFSSSWTSCRSCWSGQRFMSTLHLTWKVFSQFTVAYTCMSYRFW